MPIPDYQTIMLPLLESLNDGQEHQMREIIEKLAQEFNLTDEDRKALLPSGQQFIFDNRVGWARTYLKKAGLIDTPLKGYIKITDRGRQVLEQSPPEVTVNYLRQFKEFKEWISAPKMDREQQGKEPTKENLTPEELIESAYKELREDLALELLKKVKSCSPSFFERLVVDLLLAMGYGGSRKDAGMAIGRSGDEGIDGIIKGDKLGLDVVYIQAKRWENPVSRPEIQKFAGALMGKKAKKGIFITTSSFSRDAIEYADKIESKIVLINGETLAQLMIDHDIGVSNYMTYTLKKVDNDYFSEE
ncbi:MAG: restriction endonuclease [Acidobacteriota bacterium]|nr:restriction endonuclease [Acidobacteriota bacterium]